MVVESKQKSTPQKNKSKKSHPSRRLPQTNQHLHASRFEDLPEVKIDHPGHRCTSGSPPGYLVAGLGGMKKNIHTPFDVSKQTFTSTSCTSIFKVSESFNNKGLGPCRSVSARICKPGGLKRSYRMLLKETTSNFWSADSG